MKHLCLDLMFLSKINQGALETIFAFSEFKVSVPNDVLCDILLSVIPF